MLRRLTWLTATVAALAGSAVRGADSYTLDPEHTSVTFMVQHLGISYIHGRFNDVAGDFVIDKENPAKSSFKMTIKAKSLDTGIGKRDDHLRSPDFFNVIQYPLITFQSTAVKAIMDGYEVTGDLEMHGKKKSITFGLQGGSTAAGKDDIRIGFHAGLPLQRKDFGVGPVSEQIGDTVHVYIGMEGTRKK